MPFLQLTLEIGSQDPGPFEDALFELGATAVTLEDASDDPVLEPAPGATPLWPTVKVKALFDAALDLGALGRQIKARCGEAVHPEAELIGDRPWEREWLRDFRPMRFGRRLWVCPGGQPAGDPGGIRIELDPGLAFGTGTHATTALCLEWMDRRDLAGFTVVDYGCGSGILAIAALKLGAGEAIAIDIDPQALIATRENAQRNRVAASLRAGDESLLGGCRADVLIANILAAPLVELAPRLAEAVTPGGQIALCGLLAEQADSVTAAYRAWFDIAVAEARDGWVLLGGTRRTS
ncbi:MAG TPA: 50S ribosomal protein L11 methyltransferase [Steroidobacteraceae bacterium]|nr:50S ribosomal protein L11 methyltransferase [Steroidobacteraceae bacterium]